VGWTKVLIFQKALQPRSLAIDKKNFFAIFQKEKNFSLEEEFFCLKCVKTNNDEELTHLFYMSKEWLKLYEKFNDVIIMDSTLGKKQV